MSQLYVERISNLDGSSKLKVEDVVSHKLPFDKTMEYPAGSLGEAVKLAAGGSELKEELASENGARMIGVDLPSGEIGNVEDYLKLLDSQNINVHLKEKPGSDRTQDIIDAIVSMRANPVQILDDIGGETITVYSSGVLELGRGVFKITPDIIKITQDLGLTIRGQGSRRTNNAVKAPTTILVSGASNGFGIQLFNAGARGFTLENLDLCYENSTFTGDLLDIVGCPGTTLDKAFLGTYGTTGNTRLQTAKTCLRMSYYEFVTIRNCVFDGSIDHIWSDDARIQNGNTGFVGSNVTVINTVFYDCTGKSIKYLGNRTSNSLNIIGCTFNPIAVSCLNSLDIRGVEGLLVTGCHFAGSVANHATSGWVYLYNVTGSFNSNALDDLSDAGTIAGNIDVSNNRIFCKEGFNFVGGVITGKNNTYSKANKAVTFSPSYLLSFDMGPDLFKSGVSQSYNIPSTSSELSGIIRYSLAQDNSINKFSNNSSQVSISDNTEQSVTVSGNRSISIFETGKRFIMSGTSAQTISLPIAQPGLKFKISKIVSQTLTITCQSGNSFYIGNGSTKTVINQAAADIGGSFMFESLGISGWIVTASGNFSVT